MERIVYIKDDRCNIPEELFKLTHEQIRERIKQERQNELEKTKATEDRNNILAEIQGMFQEDKGWYNEENMIADMAAFRKERMGL